MPSAMSHSEATWGDRGIGCPHRSADHLQALGSEYGVEPGREVGVPIMD